MSALSVAAPSDDRLAGLRRVALRLGGLVLVIAVWQALTSGLRVPAYILPQPSALVGGFIADRQQLLNGLEPLLVEAGAGFVMGNALGVLLAVGVNRSETFKTAVMPLALAIRSVPIVAVTPLITLLLGFGFKTTVTVATLITFFPTFINMTRGLRAVNPDALQFLRLLNSSQWAIFWKLRWPSAVPYLFASLRVSGPAAILGATLAEYIASNSGLGYMIQNASVRYQFNLMWEATIIATAVVIVVFSIVSWAEQRAAPWAHQN